MSDLNEIEEGEIVDCPPPASAAPTASLSPTAGGDRLSDRVSQTHRNESNTTFNNPPGVSKENDNFSDFFSVGAANSSTTPVAAALLRVSDSADIREIIRSVSSDGIPESSPATAGSGSTESAKKRSGVRMAWGQGLRRQTSSSGSIAGAGASSGSATAAVVILEEEKESSSDVTGPVNVDMGVITDSAGTEPMTSNAEADVPESTAVAEALNQREDAMQASLNTATAPSETKPVFSMDLEHPSSEKEVAQVSVSSLDSETPNTGISLKLSSSIPREVCATVGPVLPSIGPKLTDESTAATNPPQSHKDRAIKGVSGNSQFSGMNCPVLDHKRKLKASTSEKGSKKPPSAANGSVEKPPSAANGSVESKQGPENSGAMELCIETAEGPVDVKEDLLSPEAKEVTSILESKKDTKRPRKTEESCADPAVEGQELGQLSDDEGEGANNGSKRKRGRPSGFTPTVGGRSGPGGGRSRGSGRQGRGGGRRRTNDPSGEVSTEEAEISAFKSALSRPSAPPPPPVPSDSIMLLGTNSVKLCESHQQRLRAKSQRDPMLSILSKKQDNINVFVAIHEIVRLELDSQGIDLMRLDPSCVIDPKIIQLLRNISNPSSLVNLSILNCADVASSLHLLETKGHKLCSEYNVILQEIYRQQKERTRLYELHLENHKFRQRLTAAAAAKDVQASDSETLVPAKGTSVTARMKKRRVSEMAEETGHDVDVKRRFLASSNPLVLKANHPSFIHLIRGISNDNKSLVEDSAFSTSVRSSQVAQNCVLPPYFVDLQDNLHENDIKPNTLLEPAYGGPGGGCCFDKVVHSLAFGNMSRLMRDNRGAVIKEIRRRKLLTRDAWEYLEDKFQETQHKWKHHVACQMKDIEERQAVLDRSTRSTLAAANAAAAAALTPCTENSGLGSAGGLGEYAYATGGRTGSSTRGVRGNVVDSNCTDFANNETLGGTRLYRVRSSVNSSSTGNLFGLGDPALFDDDAALQKVAYAELMQKRIATGWARVPDLLSPWPGPKRTATPPPLKWPESIAKFYNGKKVDIGAVKVEKTAKPHQAVIKRDDSVDISGVAEAMTSLVDTVIARATSDDQNYTSADVADAVLSEVVSDALSRAYSSVESSQILPAVDVKVEPLTSDVASSGVLPVEEQRVLHFPLPYPAPPVCVDVYCNRLTTNGIRQMCALWPAAQACPPHCNCALRVDIEERHSRVWSDMEKCIFVDKFIQYPKNFAKIASYLSNRSVKDCVRFYYDSKNSFSFKALLRECQSRRRAAKPVWRQCVVSAAAAGGALYAPDDNDDKRPVYELPVDDMTFLTRGAHPSYTDTLLGQPFPLLKSTNLDRCTLDPPSTGDVDVDGTSNDVAAIGNAAPVPRLPDGTQITKCAAAIASSYDGKYMRVRTAATYMRRLVDLCDSDSDVEEESLHNISSNGYLASVMKKRKLELNTTMLSSLPNIGRICMDIEKSISCNDSNVESVFPQMPFVPGDSVLSHVVNRPWRIVAACGADMASAPVAKEVKETLLEPIDADDATNDQPGLVRLGALGRPRPLPDSIQTPGRGRPRGPLSPDVKDRPGRGRGMLSQSVNTSEASVHPDETSASRGRGRGRGRGTRGPRGGRGMRPTPAERDSVCNQSDVQDGVPKDATETFEDRAAIMNRNEEAESHESSIDAERNVTISDEQVCEESDVAAVENGDISYENVNVPSEISEHEQPQINKGFTEVNECGDASESRDDECILAFCGEAMELSQIEERDEKDRKIEESHDPESSPENDINSSVEGFTNNSIEALPELRGTVLSNGALVSKIIAVKNFVENEDSQKVCSGYAVACIDGINDVEAVEDLPCGTLRKRSRSEQNEQNCSAEVEAPMPDLEQVHQNVNLVSESDCKAAMEDAAAEPSPKRAKIFESLEYPPELDQIGI